MLSFWPEVFPPLVIAAGSTISYAVIGWPSTVIVSGVQVTCLICVSIISLRRIPPSKAPINRLRISVPLVPTRYFAGFPDVALDDLAAEPSGDPKGGRHRFLCLAHFDPHADLVGLRLREQAARGAVLHAVQLVHDREQGIPDRLLQNVWRHFHFPDSYAMSREKGWIDG